MSRAKEIAADAGFVDHTRRSRRDRESLLARAFVQVSGSKNEGGAVTRLATSCVKLLDVAAAGVFLLDGDQPQLATSTDPTAAAMENWEVRTNQGPGVASCHSEAPVRAEDLSDTAALRQRWPDWAPAVNAKGPFRAAHALPMRHTGQTIGGVEMLTRHPGTLDGTDLALAQALAHAATATVLALRALHHAQERAAQLQTALDSRVLIEQAKGVLAQREGLSVSTAFDVMRRYARSNNLCLHDVARDVVHGRDAGPNLIITRSRRERPGSRPTEPRA